MNLNLNRLIQVINKRYRDNENKTIILEIDIHNHLSVSKGSVVYPCGDEELFKVLDKNNVSLKNDFEIYDVLSKYLVNQLSRSLGKKVHPEILNLDE